jgi:hypothetical protein
MRFLTLFSIIFMLYGLNSGCVATNQVSRQPVYSQEEIQRQKSFISSLTFNDFDEYKQDLNTVMGGNLKKESMESTQEFLDRRSGIFEKYKQKAYKIRKKIDNKENKKNEMVFFDPDTSKLLIRLPGRDKDIITFHPKRRGKAIWLHYSFVRVEPITSDYSTYIASNALGQKAEIVKIRETGIGVAVLNTIGNWSDKSQSFSMAMQREFAKSILADGSLEMEVFIDYPYIDVEKSDPFVEEQVLREPKMDKPYDVDVRYYGFPVRLVSLRLLDSSGSLVQEWNGTQIFTPAVSVE